MRRLDTIKKLDDDFAMFIVNIDCKCGHSRCVKPDVLAKFVGWKCTLDELSKKLRCSKCQAKEPEVFATPEPRPRGRQERTTWSSGKIAPPKPLAVSPSLR